MSAETIPADVRALAENALPFGYSAGYHTPREGWIEAIARAILADRSTRPAEPAAPVAEAGDGEVVAWRRRRKGCVGAERTWTMCPMKPERDREFDLEPLVRLSTLEAERARADAAEQRAADALARAEKKGSVWAAAQSLFASASTTYRKRNGQIGSIEGDDGEISYIVPFDAVETLRMAAAEQAFASSGSDTAEGALAEAREDGWRSITPEDCEVATVQTFGTITLRNSHPAWVRDDDGRTYEAVWTVDDRGRAYWWDIEAESPVDPVAIYPHPLAARASREAQPATDGGDNG